MPSQRMGGFNFELVQFIDLFSYRIHALWILRMPILRAETPLLLLPSTSFQFSFYV